MKDKNDNVYHPKHYEIPGLPVESIVIIRAVLGEEGFKKFCRGNALKYLIRADNKGGVEDLKKARVYLGWEIGDSPDGVDLIGAAKNISDYCGTQSCSPECMFFDSRNRYTPCKLGNAPDMWEVELKGNYEEDGFYNDIDGDES